MDYQGLKERKIGVPFYDDWWWYRPCDACDGEFEFEFELEEVAPPPLEPRRACVRCASLSRSPRTIAENWGSEGKRGGGGIGMGEASKCSILERKGGKGDLSHVPSYFPNDPYAVHGVAERVDDVQAVVILCGAEDVVARRHRVRTRAALDDTTVDFDG